MSGATCIFRQRLQIANWLPSAIFILHLAFCILQSSDMRPQAPISADAESTTTTTTPGRMVYEISRLRNYDDPRLPVARRDTVELSPPVRFGVALLRTIALAGLFVFFLGIERRTTSEIVHNSQVAVLVDVSQSMGLSAADGAAMMKELD